MAEHRRTTALVLGLCLLAGLTALGYLLRDAAIAVKSLERTVTVKGLSEREVAANVAAWPIDFQVAGNDLDETYSTIESNAGVVKAFLVRHAISPEEVTLSPPSVTDLYAQQWGDKSQIKYRYTGTGTVTVYSENVTAVRAAMANIIELGKSGVVLASNTHPSQMANLFLFTQLNDLKPAMVEEATKNARSVADKFAADSDSRLGKIKRAMQGQFSIMERDATTPHIKKVRVVSTIEYYLVD